MKLKLKSFSHLQYTIPPAIVLSLCYRPLCTHLDVYKLVFLTAVCSNAKISPGHANKIKIAVVATIPWDSYLIQNRIWSYPADAIIGPTLFSIPAEEVFFFVIQTYNTTLLYLILNKPTLHPIYLRGEKLLHDGRRLRLWRWLGNIILAAGLVYGATLVNNWGNGLYMGLILIWALPFIFVLWYVRKIYQ